MLYFCIMINANKNDINNDSYKNYIVSSIIYKAIVVKMIVLEALPLHLVFFERVTIYGVYS